jgi:ribokinase
MKPLKIGKKILPYDVMIGVGGIGTGMFFLLDGDHTLGREESRSGKFLDKNDYCKLHIISHYVKALLGDNLKVIPVGKVGKDDPGKKLIGEMKEAGLESEYIELDETRQTLFSFCFLYPDHSGGNMTTNNSACSSVDEKYLFKAEKEIKKFAGRGIALAAPEVSLEVRISLLNLASQYDFFKVASFTSGEMEVVINSGILKKVDLLCINLDEAIAAFKTNPESVTSGFIESCMKKFVEINSNIIITITCGKDGSWAWKGNNLSYLPAEKVEVISTAGAGDAFTAGMIAGISLDLTIQDSQQLATLTGGCSVTSPHTINKELDRNSLLKIIKNSRMQYSKQIFKLLEE